MGIKNLKIVLAQKCQVAINERKLDSYKGMTIGIDTSIFLYKYLYNNDDHIEGLTRLILRLMKNEITPLFVLDGKPPKEKSETLQDRRERREVLVNKKNVVENCINFSKSDYETFKNEMNLYIKEKNIDNIIMDEDEIKDLFNKNELEIVEESEKIAKKIIYVTSAHIESAKNLFKLFGVPYIHAPCEAESLLAVFSKENWIDGCISEDTDILANGGFLFLRNFSADKNVVEEYCLEGILSCLELNYEEFIDMCILCGCDYLPKIIGIGPITAHKIIVKYKNIETFFVNNKKYVIPENFDYVKARDLFKNPVPKELYQNMKDDIKMTQPNTNELLEFLKTTKLKEKYLKEIEKNIIIYYMNITCMDNIVYENIQIKKITDFFSKKEGNP